MSLARLREEAARLLPRLEWQFVGDSPTTKYYTDWASFERLLEAGVEERASPPEGWRLAVGCGDGGAEPLGLLAPRESKLAAAHYAGLSSVDEVVVERGALAAGLCDGAGRGWLSQHVVARLRGGVLALVGARRSGGTLVVEAEAEGRAALGVVVLPASPLAVLVRARLRRGSRLAVSLVVASTSPSRVEATGYVGERGELELYGYLVAGRGVLDALLNAVHDGASSRSLVRGFGAAGGTATVVVRGLARVPAQARGSSTRVELEALALGDGSRAYTAPFLEVDTGAVEHASHSAASYRLGVDQLFYLQSRGLSEADAVALLLRERLGTVVAPISAALEGAPLDLRAAVASVLRG